MMEMDIFRIRWGDANYKILAVIDTYMYFELNAVIQSENIEEEIEVLNRQWLTWSGHPKIIKTDFSDTHMSDFFQV